MTPIVTYGKILLLCLKVGVVRPFDSNESAKTVQKLNFTDSRSGVPAVSDSENPLFYPTIPYLTGLFFQERRKFFKLWQSVKEINVKFGR